MNRKQLRNIIEEAYIEVLREQGTVLMTGTQEVLGKFPTLKRTIVNLLTSQYEDFVKEVQWVAPKPSMFKVILKSDETFFLKWLGKGFEAKIAGKRYYLPTQQDYQQALDKLGELLTYTSPPEEEPGGESTGFETEPEGGAPDLGDLGMGGGTEPEGGEEAEVEFEEPGEEPV